MREHLLIDGFNFAHSSSRASPKGKSPDIKAMVYALETYAFKKNVKATVVLDGVRFEGEFTASGAVDVLFSRPPETADEEIRRLMDGVPVRDRLSWVLVTDDGALRETARARGLRVWSTQEMARELDAALKQDRDAPPAKRPGPFNNPFSRL